MSAPLRSAVVSVRNSGFASIAVATGTEATRTAEPGSPAWGSWLHAGPKTSPGWVTPPGAAFTEVGAVAGVVDVGAAAVGAGPPQAATATASTATAAATLAGRRRWIFLTCLFLLEHPPQAGLEVTSSPAGTPSLEHGRSPIEHGPTPDEASADRSRPAPGAAVA